MQRGASRFTFMKLNLLSRPGASYMSWHCIVHSSSAVIVLPPQDKGLTEFQLWNYVVPSICSSASGAWLSEQTRSQEHWRTCVSTSTDEQNLHTLCFKAVAALFLHHTYTYIFNTCWNAVFFFLRSFLFRMYISKPFEGLKCLLVGWRLNAEAASIILANRLQDRLLLHPLCL